jgi:hypothetical protein
MISFYMGTLSLADITAASSIGINSFVIFLVTTTM